MNMYNRLVDLTTKIALRVQGVNSLHSKGKISQMNRKTLVRGKWFLNHLPNEALAASTILKA